MNNDYTDSEGQRMNNFERTQKSPRKRTHRETQQWRRQGSQRQTIIDIYHFAVVYFCYKYHNVYFGSYWRTLYALAAFAWL